jgi:hypothetical protein
LFTTPRTVGHPGTKIRNTTSEFEELRMLAKGGSRHDEEAWLPEEVRFPLLILSDRDDASQRGDSVTIT